MKKKPEKKVEKSVSKAEKFREEKKAAESKKKFMVWGAIVLVVALIFGAMVMLSDDGHVDQTNLVFGDDVIEMTYFHWTRCAHCIKQNSYNKYLVAKYPNLKINEFEITNPATSIKYKEVAAKIDGLDPEKFPGTPLSVFETTGEFNIGYGTDDTSGKTIEEMILRVQKQIDDNWDVSSMKRTIELRDNSQ